MPENLNILRLKDVLRFTGLSRSSIYRLIAEGNFPKQISLGARAVGWLSTDIEQWLGNCVNNSQGGANE